MSDTSDSLAAKVAVVTGGSSGIGAAAARHFAAAGARVAVVASRDIAKAAAVVRTLPGDGHRAYVADVTDTAALVGLAGDVGGAFGRADILVNAAGVTRPVAHSDLNGLDDALIDRIFAVNWRGPFASVRAFAPLLRSSGDGLVVNVSSIAATTAVGSNIAYCASKAGVDVMGAALARALAPAIRVLTVSPGVVDTDFVVGRDAAASAKIAASTPLRRIASVDDIARAILACATTLTFSTGSVIQVDGGRHL
jgi:NAD(P)-dependent dehydrogenase (short-subunit alcohol dehydrogenase family)